MCYPQQLGRSGKKSRHSKVCFWGKTLRLKIWSYKGSLNFFWYLLLFVVGCFLVPAVICAVFVLVFKPRKIERKTFHRGEMCNYKFIISLGPAKMSGTKARFFGTCLYGHRHPVGQNSSGPIPKKLRKLWYISPSIWTPQDIFLRWKKNPTVDVLGKYGKVDTWMIIPVDLGQSKASQPQATSHTSKRGSHGATKV